MRRYVYVNLCPVLSKSGNRSLELREEGTNKLLAWEWYPDARAEEMGRALASLRRLAAAEDWQVSAGVKAYDLPL